jgi:hypothetical protein
VPNFRAERASPRCAGAAPRRQAGRIADELAPGIVGVVRNRSVDRAAAFALPKPADIEPHRVGCLVDIEIRVISSAQEMPTLCATLRGFVRRAWPKCRTNRLISAKMPSSVHAPERG